MKFVLFFAAFLVIFSVVFSAQFRYPPKPDGKPGYCWSEPSGPMKKAEVKNIEGQCSQAICNNDTTIVLFSCGAVAEPATEIDYSKPYPSCCPQPK